MKKFFLFKRRDVNITSTTTSDTGEGLDILAVSVDQLAFMTASSGRVNIVFNDATIYEESNLLDGESFKKTSVTVACEAGGEAALIDSIMDFISSDRVKTNVMRFDAVEGRTNVKEAKIEALTDVVSEVRQLPVVRTTQKVSKRTFIGGTDGTAFGTGATIAGIEFGDGNVPDIDYNEDGFTTSAGNITAWANSGSGSTTYDISTIGGTIPLDTSTGRSNNGLATQAADIGTSAYFDLPDSYTAEKEFTMYCVIGRSTSDIQSNPKLGFLVQGSATSGQGLTYAFVDPLDNNNFKFKFGGEKGGFVTVPSPSPIITSDVSVEEMKTCYVFVIRRDEESNIIIYDNAGTAIAIAAANTVENSYERTDGNLVLRHLGNGLSEYKFQGNLARFGVIPRDIGSAAASQLAIDLDNKYKTNR